MVLIVSKIPLLCIQAFCAHIAVKPPNPPPSTEDEKRHTTPNGIPEPFPGFYTVKHFRVRPLSPSLSPWQLTITLVSFLPIHLCRGGDYRTLARERRPLTDLTQPSRRSENCTLECLSLRVPLHVHRCCYQRRVLSPPGTPLHLPAIVEEGTPPRHGRPLLRRASPQLCRLVLLLPRRMLRPAGPRIVAYSEWGVGRTAREGVGVIILLGQCVHMHVPGPAGEERGFGLEAGVWAAMGELGEEDTV